MVVEVISKFGSPYPKHVEEARKKRQAKKSYSITGTKESEAKTEARIKRAVDNPQEVSGLKKTGQSVTLPAENNEEIKLSQYVKETKVGTGTKKEYYLYDARTQRLTRQRVSSTGQIYSGETVTTKQSMPILTTVKGQIRSEKDAVGIGQKNGKDIIGLLYSISPPKPKDTAEQKKLKGMGLELEYLEGKQKGEPADLMQGLFMGEYAEEKIAERQARKEYERFQNLTLSTRRIVESDDYMAQFQLYAGTGLLSSSDPLGLLSLGQLSYNIVQGQGQLGKEQFIQTKSLALYEVETARKRFDSFLVKGLTSPVGTALTITPVASTVFGVGAGAISTVSKTGGKLGIALISGIGLGAISGDIGLTYLRKDYDNTIRKLIITGINLPVAVGGFKAGFKTGVNVFTKSKVDYSFILGKELTKLTKETPKATIKQYQIVGVRNGLKAKGVLISTIAKKNLALDVMGKDIFLRQGETFNILLGKGVYRGFFGNVKSKSLTSLFLGTKPMGKEFYMTGSIGKTFFNKVPSINLGFSLGKNQPSGTALIRDSFKVFSGGKLFKDISIPKRSFTKFDVFNQIGVNYGKSLNTPTSKTLTFAKLLVPKGKGTPKVNLLGTSPSGIDTGTLTQAVQNLQVTQGLQTLGGIQLPKVDITPTAITPILLPKTITRTQGETRTGTKTISLQLPNVDVKQKSQKITLKEIAPLKDSRTDNIIRTKTGNNQLNIQLPKVSIGQEKNPFSDTRTTNLNLRLPKQSNRLANAFIPLNAQETKTITPMRARALSLNIAPPPPPISLGGGGLLIPFPSISTKDTLTIGRKGKKKGKSYDYAPSLGAVVLGITAPKIPKTLRTGAEIRPIIINKKRKR